MEVITKTGGSILSGIIELVIKRSIEKVQDHWLGSSSKLRSALQNIQRKLSIIKRRITHAEKRAYIDRDSAAKDWMESLQEIVCDTDKVLDEIEYRHLKEKFKQKNKLGSFMLKYKPFGNFEYVMITKLNEIDTKLDGLVQLADSYKLEVVVDQPKSSIYINSQQRTTTSIFDNNIFGRDAIRDRLVELLTQDNLTIDEEHILSIVGMGGIGKTTLAQMVYNHEKVNGYFDLKIWVCVSDDFDEKKIISQILESISYCLKEKGESEGSYANLDVLAQKLVDKLKGKRYFVVLDDIWNENPGKWKTVAKCLKTDEGNKGSKVLVTTRNKSVAKIISSLEPILLDGLSDDVLWHLLKTFVFGSIQENPLELEDILKRIMSKLKGSPLAAKTVGHILRSNPNKRHWENILSSEIWALKQNEDDITPALMLSYQNLPEYLKPCFAFCSLYPKDYFYEKKKIVQMWIALGYIQEQRGTVLMEEIGGQYVDELLDRCMFQPCTKDDVQHRHNADAGEWFKIHDLIHDVAKMVSTNESLMIHDECTIGHLSSSIQNLSIYFNEKSWSWGRRDSFDDFSNVRTLIFLSKNGLVPVEGGFYLFLQKALPKMKFLRVLDLSEVKNENFSLPKLKHLRYLNINVSTVDKLPSSLKYLYQLQVLECWEVSGHGIRRPLYPPAPARPIRYSENLRHILGFGFDTNADPFLERFHSLQELDLSVSKQSKLFSTRESVNGHHKLKALRTMKWVRELSISGLENVESKEEALEAGLRGMDHLTKLSLSWGPTPSGDNIGEILEALHPGPNVSVFKIQGYAGTGCPGWMGSLSLLRELRVTCCRNIKFIPTSMVTTVRRLEFQDCENLCVQDRVEGFCALNSLEELTICGCPQLIADLVMDGHGGGLPSSLKDMSLEHVGNTIINTSNTILQSLTNLTGLTISKESSDSSCFIAPSPINSPKAQQLQQLSHLFLLKLSTEEVKGWLLHLQGCTALVSIILWGMNIRSFDTEMDEILVGFVSLRSLSLYSCRDCRSPPSRLSEISSLRRLVISNCPKMETLPERGLPPGLQDLLVSDSPLLIEHLKKVRGALPDRLQVWILTSVNDESYYKIL